MELYDHRLNSIYPRGRVFEYLPLGTLDGDTFSRATAISGDGSTIVGTSEADGPGATQEAFRWTAEDGMIGLGQVSYSPVAFPGFSFLTRETKAFAASQDGSVIVGGAEAAWIWSEQMGGMVSLRDLLISLNVPGIENWDLFEAVDVSADGTVITG